ncbi:uncharacterized protein BXZ73DRAFT_101841 [Epithele typhae]|uniref:uncharacterized protein n=1 Tax=Epithele typhae TaxID=378194 RepID=UPI002007B0C7|nr:uncharacterized protein BXZ73DRAFT_101841 [Epithele typhae]KAH9930468.1 hypothetical protein BXZ73DRAFT_101841 [Epithele typhae]
MSDSAPSFRALESQIAFITTVLHLARPAVRVKFYNKSTRTYNKIKTEIKVGVWHSTSFILATGDENDPVGAKGVAITGRRTREEIGVLLSRNLSQRADATAHLSPGPSSPPFLGNRTHGYQAMLHILRCEQKGFKVKPEQHIQDVVNVAQFYVTRTPGPLDGAHRVLLLAFIAHRCCIKLASRIELGRTMWPGLDKVRDDERLHPAAFIYNKLLDATTKLPNIQTGTVVPMPSFLQSHLEDGGLCMDPSRPAASDYDSYPVTRENAASWAQLLWNSVDTMERVLKAVKEETVTAQLFLDFERAMWLLKYLVGSGVLEHIVAGSIKEELNRARKIKYSNLEGLIYGKNQHSTSAGQTFGQGDDVTASDFESALELEQEVAEAFSDDGEGEDPLVRHLKALVIPDDIVDIFMTLSSPVDHPRVEAVLVNDGYLAPLDDASGPFIDSLRKDIEAVLKREGFDIESAKLQQVLDDAVERVNTASVHAESALMARALSVHENPDSATPSAELSKEASDLVKEVLENEEIAIGVGKRSCFCCDLLSQLIAHRGSTNLDFVLPGTHPTIFPWHPPPGLSTDILQAIKDRLIEAMKEVLGAAISSTQPTLRLDPPKPMMVERLKMLPWILP